MTAPMMKPMENVPESGQIYLIFEFERRAYPIGPESFTIGRAGRCDIVIREPSVSRVHAEVSQSPEGIVIKPVGATPTIVNGAPVEGSTVLHHGDQVEIGSARLTLSEFSLPLGVSIVDRSGTKASDDDIGNRRPTITNPILSGRANPNQSPASKIMRPTVLLGILILVAAYYFFGVILS